MKEFSTIPIILLVAGAATQVAAEGNLHAQAFVQKGLGGPSVYTEDWSPHWGVAQATAIKDAAWVNSFVQMTAQNQADSTIYSYFPCGYYGWGHAHHHGGSHVLDGGERDDEPRELPDIRSHGSILSVQQRWAPSDLPGMVRFTLLPSFMQINVDPNCYGPDDSLSSIHRINVGDQTGTVMLRGTLTRDGWADFEASLSGILSEMEFRMRRLGPWTMVLEVAGIQLDVPGDIENLAVGVDASLIPEPGTAALLGLGGLLAIRRRR